MLGRAAGDISAPVGELSCYQRKVSVEDEGRDFIHITTTDNTHGGESNTYLIAGSEKDCVDHAC